MTTALARLLEHLDETAQLHSIRALLLWDADVVMPSGAAESRADQIGTLTRLRHRRLGSDELGRLLDAVERHPDFAQDAFATSLVRVSRRGWETARRVPAELTAELAQAASSAQLAWRDARRRSDFAAFLPHLERVLALKRRYCACFEAAHPYDVLLDDYEPGMTTADVKPVLERLRAGIVELLDELPPPPVAVQCLDGDVAVEQQVLLASELLAQMPFAPETWRLDPSTHAFTITPARSDLRMTVDFGAGQLGKAIWVALHEAGHALYRGGIDPRLERTPLARAASLSFDESQARLWESWVGRGRPFLAHLLPLLRERFPERFAGVDVDALYRAANRVAPSPIRRTSDEVTYNLHIVLRFELELELLEERLRPADLPEAWAARMSADLGLDVPDDAHGVLQDVHWASGAFAYFPAYALGNVIAGQTWEMARRELPGLDGQLAAGELAPLFELLRERIYRHGSTIEPAAMIERVAGDGLSCEPLLRHLRERLSELRALDAA